MNGTCIVHYDRSKRKWLCISPNGDFAEFPPGKEGQQAAKELMVRYQLPVVSNYLNNLKNTEHAEHSYSRAFKGALLVAGNHVVKPHDELLKIHPKALAKVYKENSDKYYLITPGRKHYLYKCNCEDFWKGDIGFKMGPYRYDLKPIGAPHIKDIGLICKHLWAYHFALLTENIQEKEVINAESD